MIKTYSSSTPTATFSGSELLYQSDGVHRSHGDELASSSDMPSYDRERQRLRDLEVGNRRPGSRSKKMSIVDKVSFEREKEDLRMLSNSLPSKPPALRNGGHRNSLVRGEQMIATGRNGASNSNREPDELIAMGTIWSPANSNNINNNNNSNNNNTNNNHSNGSNSTGPATTRSSSNTANSNKSQAVHNNNNINNNNNNTTSSTSNSFSHRKPGSLSSSFNNTGRSSHSNTGGNYICGNRTQKDSKDEPKYSDPLAGAPASFQQRLMDLASLEAETIRWERTKKVKKKPKQDRDS